MPKPREGESKNKFIERCITSEEMNEEFKDQDQRAAVCYKYWRKHKKE